MIRLTNIVRLPSSPARNMAVEEGLRMAVEQELALGNPCGFFSTYVNSACIVLGRNQDARSEVSARALWSGTPAVFRRTSGGGAVYHDQGNLNWSFVVPGTLIDRESLLEVIVKTLRNTGIPAGQGPRGELVANGRKIGGTASSTGKGVLLFHGTILVSVDLAALEAGLAAHEDRYSSDAVRSVPSRIANVSEMVQGIDVESLARILGRAVGGAAASDWRNVVDRRFVDLMTLHFSSTEWILDRSVSNAIDTYRRRHARALNAPMKGIA